MDFQQILERAWPRVRERHLFPELPAPEVAEGEEMVAIQMRGKQIRLNRAHCEALAEHMPPDVAVEALLDHGVAHYTVCPWDFETHMALYAALKPVLLDGRLIKRVVDYFMDVVVDTHCVKDRNSRLPDVYRRVKTDGAGEVIRALYQKIWGVDLDIAEEPEAVSRLARIPYLDRRRWGEAIRAFARIVAPLIEEEEAGQGGGSGGMMGEHGLQQYSDEEIQRGLKQFVEQGFYAFRAMVEDFREELKAAGQLPEPGMGRGRGVPKDADLLYYMQRARLYRLPIRTVPMEKVGGLHPHSHAPWELGRPVQDIDIWTSFGKILPGISQVWERRQGETHGTDEGTPDCLIVVDSSGSMANPCEELSYAVLGAGCAADAYLNRRRKVAVYNFSDAPAGGREVLEFTRNRQSVYRTLCRYFGGGTALHLPDLKSLRRERADIFIITDMQITNLQGVIDYLTGADCRVTAVHVGKSREAEQFRRAVGASKNICVYPVEKPEDIPKIVLAEVEARFVE